jgi:Domain of unknown function (DUF4037)
MTEHLDRAFVLAQRLADNYAQIPAVEAVALAGSRTSGSSDEDSDIDLYVYASAVLPLDQRAKVAAGAKRAELGNDFWEPGDEWIDPETGISVDVMFRTTPWIEEQLDRVLRRHEASVGYSTCFWYNVRNSQALFDRAGCFATVQQKANQPYPEGLKRAIVAKNHPILRNNMSSYLHQIEKALQRQDSVSVNHRLTALLASYFDILFAINEQPHPGEKRLLVFAERLCPQRPPHLREHVTGALASPAASNLNALIDGLDTLLRRQKLLPL